MAFKKEGAEDGKEKKKERDHVFARQPNQLYVRPVYRGDVGTYTNFVNDGYGYGFAQWTYYSRKQGLLDYAVEQKASVGNLDMQLDFLIKELSKSYYSSVLSTLKSATTVKEASDAVLTGYEKPANQSDSAKIKRAGYGQTYYDKYVGDCNTLTSSSASTGSASTSAVTEQKATDPAKSFNKSLAGTYKTTANLYIRNGAGQGKAAMVVLPKGTSVKTTATTHRQAA